MAKIGDKDINDLSSWDMKELRKLKINIKNRLEKLSLNPKSELKEKQLLAGLEAGELKQLLGDIKRAEKQLSA